MRTPRCSMVWLIVQVLNDFQISFPTIWLSKESQKLARMQVDCVFRLCAICLMRRVFTIKNNRYWLSCWILLRQFSGCVRYRRANRNLSQWRAYTKITKQETELLCFFVLKCHSNNFPDFLNSFLQGLFIRYIAHSNTLILMSPIFILYAREEMLPRDD